MDKKNALVGFLLLSPTLVVLLIFVVYPLFEGVKLSFTDMYLLKRGSGKFIGLQNFIDLATEKKFLLYMRNTAIWTAGSVVGSVALGIILAVQLNKPLRCRSVYRSLALIPWIMPIVATGVVWRWIYDGQWGILNYVLKQLGIINEYKIWLGDKHLIWISLIVFFVWKVFPFVYVIVLSILQTIPNEIYEAAKIDGASATNIFWKMTLPLIKPTVIVVTLLLTIWTANEFAAVWIMTRGGPADISMTLAPLVYMKSFLFYRTGYGASIGVLLLLTMIGFVIFYIRRVRVN